ncbi:hypothetical protein C3486_23890 [Streptomyces sp. Ru73]|uniref:hypothetical protein n=1 Tax=Streptomyces sp. Ru73 TaxID=2080748 RepID=UPI000CDD5BCF|nr:hypothetical protein [Streptomyces sp. Ru73]POX38313.1 hypothetical protein C3486_23890 [Streptomyces sp. Ru73]
MGETYGPGGSSADAVDGVDKDQLEKADKDRREAEVAEEAAGDVTFPPRAGEAARGGEERGGSE